MATKRKLNITISEVGYKLLTKIAKDSGQSRSAMIERLIREWKERK